MIFFKMKNFTLFSLVSIALINPLVAYSFEFDNAILESLGFDNVDLSAFSGENDQFTGEYLASININNKPILYTQSVHFYIKDNESKVCITPELINILPIKQEVIGSLKSSENHMTDAGECLAIETLDPTVSTDFDSNNQIVNITIPHKYVADYDPNFVPPNQRDPGISGIVFDYNLISSFNRNKYQGSYKSNSSVSSYGSLGANINRFRFRANYQYYSKSHDKKLDWTQIYGFTDIASINSKLFAGELYSRSNVFDSVRFKGVSMYSDENMMPAYLRGYAPQISGTANSNAIVTVKQYGNVLESIQVPAGPFVISNLPSYISGLVDVEVEESNGSIRTFQVNISQVPFLTRKGDIRYNTNIGRLSPLYNNTNFNTHFVSADASYGLNNTISLFGGIVLTSNREYRAFNAGVGLNLQSFGAISFDVTQANNTADNQKSLSGHSYRINYAKRFGQSTTLNLAGYRFSSREFSTLQNYVQMKMDARNTPIFEKNRVTLSLSQDIPKFDLSVTASLTKGSFWNRENTSNYNLSVNKIIKKGFFENTSVQLSLSRDKYQNGNQETQVALFINIPLNQEQNSRLQYSGTYFDSQKEASQQMTYYTDALAGQTSVGVNAYHKRDFSGSIDYSLNGSYDVTTRYGRIMTTANYSSENQRATASFDGSVTITKHGIATHPRVYENNARLIIDTEAAGVHVDNTNSVSNIFGLVGVSNVSPYYYASYKIDNDNLPDNVEIQDSVIQLAVSDGAIAYRTTNAISGEKAIATISLPDGSYPPFGAVVYRENGDNTEVAMVADQGLTYLTGLKNKTNFVVKWNGGQSCKLNIKSLEPADLQNITCYME